MVNKPANKQTDYFPPQEPFLENFEKEHKSYQLFRQAGLDKDVNGVHESGPKQGQPMSSIEKILDENIFRRLRPFLVNADPAKGPIQRKVVKLERRKGLNPESRKMQESLVVHTFWQAKDFLGNDMESTVILEGVYNKPKLQTTIVNGKTVKKYQNWEAVYDIPFSVDAVNAALENQTNYPELIKYMVRTSQSDRDDSYSLEQFRDSTWEQCVEIHRQGKGLNR